MSESLAVVNEHTYDALSGQLAYRRERRHTIFAWCSSIFVATIGGLAAFAKKPGDLNPYQQLIITVTIGILDQCAIPADFRIWPSAPTD